MRGRAKASEGERRRAKASEGERRRTVFPRVRKRRVVHLGRVILSKELLHLLAQIDRLLAHLREGVRRREKA